MKQLNTKQVAAAVENGLRRSALCINGAESRRFCGDPLSHR